MQLNVTFGQSIHGIKCSMPRHLAPIHVLRVYIGKIVHGFITFTPAIIANVLRRHSHAAVTPSTVCRPNRGDIPIKTPVEKASATL